MRVRGRRVRSDLESCLLSIHQHQPYQLEYSLKPPKIARRTARRSHTLHVFLALPRINQLFSSRIVTSTYNATRVTPTLLHEVSYILWVCDGVKAEIVLPSSGI